MLNLTFAHNIQIGEISDLDFKKLYEQKRRESHFAGAIQNENTVYAFRDQLGIVPLYYRFTDAGIQFSLDFDSLIQPSDTLIPQGIDTFTKFATVRFAQLFEEIYVVPPATVVKIDLHTRAVTTHYQYHLQTATLPNDMDWDALINEFKRLMVQAIERTLKEDHVGLYISGGIDSSMISTLLRELGIKVNGYTSGPWGKSSSDVHYARINADLTGVANHEIDYLDTFDYPAMMEASLDAFQLPKGIPTTLGLTSVWNNTSIQNERQLYFGQNCDNIMGSMSAQYLTYFLQPLPAFIRKQFHPALEHSDMFSNYLHLAKNYTADYRDLTILQAPPDMNRLHRIILAAVATVGNSSCENFTQPAHMSGIPINNPYHDVDLVEFVMGLNLEKRLRFINLHGIPRPIMEKIVIQRLAARYLPDDMINRKKAFTVSFDRDDKTRELYDNLPHEIGGIELTNENERFAGEMLKRWLTRHGISI